MPNEIRASPADRNRQLAARVSMLHGDVQTREGFNQREYQTGMRVAKASSESPLPC